MLITAQRDTRAWASRLAAARSSGLPTQQAPHYGGRGAVPRACAGSPGARLPDYVCLREPGRRSIARGSRECPLVHDTNLGRCGHPDRGIPSSSRSDPLGCRASFRGRNLERTHEIRRMPGRMASPATSNPVLQLRRPRSWRNDVYFKRGSKPELLCTRHPVPHLEGAPSSTSLRHDLGPSSEC